MDAMRVEQAIRVHQTVEEDGRVVLEGLPVRRGQTVEVIVVADMLPPERKRKTIAEILAMDAVGMWADRTDIGDSLEFARRLRKEAETRDWSDDDPA